MDAAVAAGQPARIAVRSKASGALLTLVLRPASTDQLTPAKPVGVPNWVRRWVGTGAQSGLLSGWGARAGCGAGQRCACSEGLCRMWVPWGVCSCRQVRACRPPRPRSPLPRAPLPASPWRSELELHGSSVAAPLSTDTSGAVGTVDPQLASCFYFAVVEPEDALARLPVGGWAGLAGAACEWRAGRYGPAWKTSFQRVAGPAPAQEAPERLASER